MKPDFYRQKGFWPTLATAILIISVALVTDLKTELFVPVKGKFRLFGGIGILIAVTLLFKWRFSRHILGAYTFLYLIVTIHFVINGGNHLISFLIILTVLIIILILLFSKQVKDYIN